MSEKDYEDILDQNVEEAKQAVKDLENPNYEKLLETEKEGRDRKTIKEFLEPLTEEEEETEEETEETVEAVADETTENFLTGFSRNQVLSGGLIAGIVLGLIVGFGFTATDSPQATPQEVEDSINSLFEASGESEDVEITDIEEVNGMYYASIEAEVEMEGETQTQTETFYVSPDAELLFPEIQDMMMQNPINIEETVTQMEQMEGMEEMPEEEMPGEEDIEMQEPEGDELELDEEDIEIQEP